MNTEHFFADTNENNNEGNNINQAYNSNNNENAENALATGSTNRMNNNNNNNNKNNNNNNNVNSSGSSGNFFGLQNLSTEQSFCLFNASKAYLNCVADCPIGEEENSCKYHCASKSLDDVQFCIYYEEQEEEETLVPEEETINSLKRMNTLGDAAFLPYAVYDTNYLEPKDIVKFKIKNGIEGINFAPIAQDFETPGGELIYTEDPYTFWDKFV